MAATKTTTVTIAGRDYTVTLEALGDRTRATCADPRCSVEDETGTGAIDAIRREIRLRLGRSPARTIPPRLR